MTSIQTTQNTITIQPLYKWDSEESQMTYLNLYPDYFQNQLFQKIISGIPSVSNSLDPDVGPKCLQRLSADNTRK